jgi:RNA polymerase sigma-70 factor (ECF subfamily)
MTGSVRDTAFLDLLEPVQDRLYRYALAVMGDPEDAKDLVSDTILAAYEQFDALRDRSKFLHLLLTIASRKSKRRIFRRKRFARLDDALMETLESSHLSIEAATDLSIVLDLLQHLPTRTRQTFLLYEIADMTLKEIQQIQGGSLSGVKSRLVRGREQLQVLVRAVNEPSGEENRHDRTITFERASTAIVLAERYGR